MNLEKVDMFLQRVVIHRSMTVTENSVNFDCRFFHNFPGKTISLPWIWQSIYFGVAILTCEKYLSFSIGYPVTPMYLAFPFSFIVCKAGKVSFNTISMLGANSKSWTLRYTNLRKYILPKYAFCSMKYLKLCVSVSHIYFLYIFLTSTERRERFHTDSNILMKYYYNITITEHKSNSKQIPPSYGRNPNKISNISSFSSQKIEWTGPKYKSFKYTRNFWPNFSWHKPQSLIKEITWCQQHQPTLH